MKKIRILALTLCLGAAAGRLPGQSYRTFQDEFNDVRVRAGLRLGPLKVFPLLRISDVGFDSNVLYRPKEESAISDFIGTLSPEIKGAWLLGNSVILSFTENPEWNFYLKETDLRTVTSSHVPAVRFLLARTLSLSGDHHYLQHLRRATSEFGPPVKDVQRGWNARVFFETARGTALGLAGSQDDFRVSNPTLADPADDFGRALDRRERSAALEFYYRVFSQSHFFTKAGATDYTFRDPSSSWRNARSYEALAGLRFPVLGRARGTLALGFKKFIPRAEGRKTFSGFVADTDVLFREGRFGLSLAYTRDNYFSYIEAAYYYIEDRFRGGLSFYLWPFLRLEGSYQFGAWNYPEPYEVSDQGVPYVIQNRRDRNRVFTAGLAVRIRGNAGLGLGYNFYRRRSNIPGYDIDRNFIGATLTYDF
jgi:hypothetical protein